MQFVLSIITLPPAFSNPKIELIYQTLLQNHSITKIFEILFATNSSDTDIINTLRCLAYLYSAYPQEKLRNYYQENNFLDVQLWQKIIQMILSANPDVKRAVLIVCALLAKNVPSFK